MRTAVNLDDSLLDRAEKLSGVKERSALLRAALEALIQKGSARRRSACDHANFARFLQTTSLEGMNT